MPLTTLVRSFHQRDNNRLAFQALVLTGIGVVVLIFYRSWFGGGGFTTPVWAAYGREVVGVFMQFYLLVWLFTHTSTRPRFLLVGLLGYYWLTYTYYFLTAVLVYRYTGVDDFSGAAYYFITRENQYWQTLFTYETLVRLVRFPILITVFPLFLWAGWQAYRRQLRNVQLQEQNARLELDYLKSQVNPHFLFNILNSIYALTEEENPQAARLVAQLSGLMRYALYETAHPTVPLTKELAFIEDYVLLEQTRSSRRLTLETSLPASVDERLQIAPFILITFVENAFKHGVSASARKSRVSLQIQLEDATLTMDVANSKPVAAPPAPGGLGLSNVRKRLSLLYADRHTLTIDDQPECHRVRLTVQLGHSTQKSESSLSV